MKRKNARIQPDLFEQDDPRVLPALSQKEQLATLVEALLLEIAAALANGEAASTLNQHVEDLALVVDGAPQIHPRPGDPDDTAHEDRWLITFAEYAEMLR